MADPTIQPAAHEDAKADARAAAKWLIAAFAAVGAVLVSGIGLSSIGDLTDSSLVVAALAAAAALGGVIIAVTLVADVLTPSPTTLKDLAERERKRNEARDKGKGGGDRDPLVEYLESDPSFLQGIAGDAPENESLIAACTSYEEAVAERYDAARTCWDLEKEGEIPEQIEGQARHPVQARVDVAIARIGLMHETVRRLERIAAAQQTVQKLRELRTKLIALAILVALGVGLFAYVSSSAPS